jgi:antirestriction protein ArdC
MAGTKVYEIVTEKILALLDKGMVPWRKPWKGGAEGVPANLVSKKPYRGINTLLLGFQGYASRYWLTFNQAKAKGGNVKKGEKGSMVVFWKITADEKDAAGEVTRKGFPILRYYTVFNVSQCEGIADPDAAKEQAPAEFTPIESARRIVAGMPHAPEIRHDQQQAYYNVTKDFINLPKPETFTPAEEYYAAAFHDMTHATGHDTRLARCLQDRGLDAYAREELVAEMGAAFLCAEAGIDAAMIENAAAYIQSWRKRISEDPKLVVVAAQQAQKAADYILGRTKEEKAEEPAED